MTNPKFRMLFVFFFICTISTAYAQNAQPAIDFELDLAKSKIEWQAPKNHGGSNHFGMVLFNIGHLQIAQTGMPMNASFNINMNSIASKDSKDQKQNNKVDAQLKGIDFFDVAIYPTSTMIVKRIISTKTPSIFIVMGDLTMKNVTKPIQFNAMIKKTNNQIVVKAKLVIDRMKWNVKNTDGGFFGGLKNKLIEEEIPLELDLIFNKM